MKSKTLTLGIGSLVTALIPFLWASTGRSQATGQSNYTFRFNTGVSSTFLSDMTFQKEQPLNLGACTVTEKINGPLSCAVNCQSQSVCLLDLSGPSGSSVTDVLEKVSETPVATSSPLPAASPSANPALSGSSAAFGAVILMSPTDSASNLGRRIEAYNQVKK